MVAGDRVVAAAVLAENLDGDGFQQILLVLVAQVDLCLNFEPSLALFRLEERESLGAGGHILREQFLFALGRVVKRQRSLVIAEADCPHHSQKNESWEDASEANDLRIQ